MKRADVAEVLLENGIDIDEGQKGGVNAKNFDGDTALMLASLHGHDGVVKLLLKHKDIDVNTTNNRGKTALMLASRYGNTDVVELLLEHKDIDVNARDSDDGYTALIWASSSCSDGCANVVELLLKTQRY